jgi:hypothetical protein
MLALAGLIAACAHPAVARTGLGAVPPGGISDAPTIAPAPSGADSESGSATSGGSGTSTQHGGDSGASLSPSDSPSAVDPSSPGRKIHPIPSLHIPSDYQFGFDGFCFWSKFQGTLVIDMNYEVSYSGILDLATVTIPWTATDGSSGTETEPPFTFFDNRVTGRAEIRTTDIDGYAGKNFTVDATMQVAGIDNNAANNHDSESVTVPTVVSTSADTPGQHIEFSCHG